MIKRFLLLICFACISILSQANDRNFIKVSTDEVDLIFNVAEDGRLYQCYLGKKLTHDADLAYLPKGTEAYLTHGMEDYYEPAIHIVHNDGNPSTLLKYVSHESRQVSPDVTELVITLKDEEYPVTVKLYYVAYLKENLIKTYTEICHKEKKPVSLQKYASSMLHLNNAEYYLTEVHGNWASEAHLAEQKLEFGKKVLDTKLGARAAMFCSPFFQLAVNEPAAENRGEVLVGTLGWTGNFSFVFEVDNEDKLRVISGINPYASEYSLAPGEIFRTPDFYFTYSLNGMGQASRNFHSWARKYQLKDGQGTRLTLLNNWEATYFDFNEEKLIGLMDDAAELGVDMFLLDDGWFANKYPRSSDHQGLGDWDETKDKLPNGIGYLTEKAKEKGVKFGLWIEPEMVNPKSELYENHKDWVIHLPNREEYYFRNQMVLDLSNPKVQDFVFGVLDDLKTKYPDIAFFKWDCNAPIINIYSTWLKNRQSHLYIEYVRGLYNVLDRVAAKYPDLPMMLCSGGGARSDYEALKYFTEFWPSDNTDPIERLFIQWGYSQVFPAKTMCAHVTTWNKKASIKFRIDVAMMAKMGFDVKLVDLTDHEKDFCKRAVKTYDEIKPVVWEGDMYRLVSPYGNNHTSTMYVDGTKDRAVLFAFDMFPRYAEKTLPVRLEGLDADKMYRVKEINMMGTRSSLKGNDMVYSGEYLMTVGLNVFSSRQMNSKVIEIVAE